MAHQGAPVDDIYKSVADGIKGVSIAETAQRQQEAEARARFLCVAEAGLGRQAGAEELRQRIGEEDETRAKTTGAGQIGATPGAIHGVASAANMPYGRGPKCLVDGCDNYFGQGEFTGPICVPCANMLRGGRPSPGGRTFVHELHYNVQRLEARQRHDKAHKLLAERCDKAKISLDPNTREVVVDAIIEAMAR